RNRIELVVATGEKKLSGLNYKPLYYTLVIEPGNSSEPCKTYDYLLHYQDKILVRKDNKSGVLNNDWQVSIPYEYDGLVGSDGNFLAAKRDSLWGIIDIKNQQLTDYGFNDAKFIDGLPCLKKNNIWSILNPFNNLDLLLEANEIHSFQSTYVSKDYIYIKGEEMSEEEIFEIQFSLDDVIIAYDDNETLGEMFAAAFGKIFATEHNPVSSEEKKEIEERTFFIKMASNIPKFEDKFLWYKLDNKMGLINAKAEIITEPIYDDIEPIDFGLGKIVQNTEVGLINYKGEIVLEPSYNTMNYFFEWYKGSKYSKILIDEKYGLIDYTGQIVINPIFDSIRIAYNYISVKQNKQWGIFDFKNNLSQNFKFSEAKINVTDFGEFSYLGYYDDSFDDSLSDCFQVTCLDGLENFSIEHKQDEKREIPISYNKKVSEKFLKNQKKRRKKFKEEIRNIPEFNDNFLWYKSDNKMGLMNLKAKIVTKPVFDDIVHIGFGLAKIVQNSKVGLINFKGEIILEPEYDTLNDFEWFGGKKYSKISLSGLFGLIDYQGNIILPMRYQEIERLENWQIMINENGIEKTIGIDELMLQEE
ncbi:MAG: WG repeat-containing protein, partial [Candidatus Cloacimonadota bacterium]|nr:WG repeat-containing protein [Candidatus Cloacimonadota bacterium]